MGGNEIADQDQDGHDDVLGNGHDVAASDLGHGDAAVCLVGGIEVDVIRADTGRDGKLEILGLGQTLCCQIARVEASTHVSNQSADM